MAVVFRGCVARSGRETAGVGGRAREAIRLSCCLVCVHMICPDVLLSGSWPGGDLPLPPDLRMGAAADRSDRLAAETVQQGTLTRRRTSVIILCMHVGGHTYIRGPCTLNWPRRHALPGCARACVRRRVPGTSFPGQSTGCCGSDVHCSAGTCVCSLRKIPRAVFRSETRARAGAPENGRCAGGRAARLIWRGRGAARNCRQSAA